MFRVCITELDGRGRNSVFMEETMTSIDEASLVCAEYITLALEGSLWVEARIHDGEVVRSIRTWAIPEPKIHSMFERKDWSV